MGSTPTTGGIRSTIFLFHAIDYPERLERLRGIMIGLFARNVVLLTIVIVAGYSLSDKYHFEWAPADYIATTIVETGRVHFGRSRFAEHGTHIEEMRLRSGTFFDR